MLLPDPNSRIFFRSLLFEEVALNLKSVEAGSLDALGQSALVELKVTKK